MATSTSQDYSTPDMRSNLIGYLNGRCNGALIGVFGDQLPKLDQGVLVELATTDRAPTAYEIRQSVSQELRISDEELQRRETYFLVETQGDNLGKLAIGEDPQRFFEKLDPKLIDRLAFGKISLTHPRILKALSPEHQTTYFTVAKNYSRLFNFYKRTVLDLTEEEAEILARGSIGPRNKRRGSAQLMLETIGAPTNVIHKSEVERLALEEKIDDPNNRKNGYSSEGHGNITETTCSPVSGSNRIATNNNAFAGPGASN